MNPVSALQTQNEKPPTPLKANSVWSSNIFTKLFRLFIPQSLLGRTAWVLFLALVIAQSLAAWLFHEYVTVPRVEASMGVFTQHIKTLSSALETIPLESHTTFFGKLIERDGLRIWRKFDGPQPRVAPMGPGLQRFRERLQDLFGQNFEIYVRPQNPRQIFVKLTAHGQEYWVSFPRQRIEKESMSAWIGIAASVIILALGGAYYIVRRLNKPLRDLADASRRLAEGQTPITVPEAGPAEIVSVTREFNRMTTALTRQERERATFLAGVSHDLRTPLTRLRLGVEMLPASISSETRQGMVADVEDMRQVIDQFLDFARDESSEQTSKVDLAALLSVILEPYQRSSETREFKTTLICEPGINVQARPVALRRMFTNLIDNAAKYGGGVIDVAVKPNGKTMIVLIEDRGPGISEADIEKLKQPFARGEEARTGADGAGLGLAIAERIAKMHKAQLKLGARNGGGGLSVTVALPN